MRASKWRLNLLGSLTLMNTLRKTQLVLPLQNLPDHNTIMQDIVRTFPEDRWYTDHLSELSKILLCFAKHNPSIGYAQGMCFIVFVLYRVFYNDCPKYATIDTFYALHTIMTHIRPLYPRPEEDDIILSFIDSTAALIRLNFINSHQRLAIKLRGNEMIKLLLVKTGPTLFANWFQYNDLLLIWDYLFRDLNIFDNFINISTAMIICHEKIYLCMNYEKTLHIISEKSFYRAISIVSSARTFEH